MSRAIALATVAFGLFANTCFAAPLVSGEVTELLGRRTTAWLVFDEFANDNPLPSSGEFTYVYNVKNSGDAEILLWEFGLLVDDDDLSSTEILGSSLPPPVISPGLWQWWTDGGSPLSLAPNERTADLVVTSMLAPGPVLAFVYGCPPLLCDIPVTLIVGPAVPEPATWQLACLFLTIMLLRRCLTSR